MPRFVILSHHCPANFPRASHWDFMLEENGRLRTWALTRLPQRTGSDSETSAGEAIEAKRLDDHRLAYLDYEGEVSGGRGTVTRWDAGEYTLVTDTEERLVLRLSGEKLQGQVTLSQNESASNGWLLTFEHDP